MQREKTFYSQDMKKHLFNNKKIHNSKMQIVYTTVVQTPHPRGYAESLRLLINCVIFGQSTTPPLTSFY